MPPGKNPYEQSSKKRKAASSEVQDLSLARPTKKSRSSAFGLFEEYEHAKDENLMEELESLEDEEAKGELVQKSLISFAEWLIQNPIMQRNSTGKTVSEAAVKQYFGQVKEELKGKTPKLPIWTNHEDEWYSQLRDNLGTGKRRSQLQGDEDFKDPSCRALPIRCELSKLRVKHRLWHELKGVDLESICRSIISQESTNRNAYRECAKLVLTALAVGRGGEVKFLRWDEFWWDDLFLVPEAVWTRMKTLTQQILYFQCDRSGYLCDFYWILGAFFAVEDGLFRVDKTKHRENRAVFPDLRCISNASVASKMTALIRKHSDEAIRPFNQSRSIRVGSNTDLAMNRDVSTEEQRLAGGFAAGNNSELYTRMNPQLGTTSANALGGHKNPREKAYPPMLDSLVGHVTGPDMDRLMERLYLISLPWFLHDGHLRPILQTVTAKLIMEYPVVRKDFGPENRLIRKLELSVVRANLALNRADAVRKLETWSPVARKQFETMNSGIPRATETTIVAAVNAQTELLNQLLQHVVELSKQNEKLHSEVATLRSTVQGQSGTMVSGLASALSDFFGSFGHQDSTETQELTVPQPMARTASVATTPMSVTASDSEEHLGDHPTTPTHTNEAPKTNRVTETRAMQQTSECTTTGPGLPDPVCRFIDTMKAQLVTAAEQPSTKPLAALAWKRGAESQSSNGVTVKELLLQLFNENKLCTGQKLYDVTPSSLPKKDIHYYRATMELVESVINEEKLMFLRLKEPERAKIQDFDDMLTMAAYEIERDAFAKMGELDGKKRAQLRPTVTGLGNRYQKYCKENQIELQKSSKKPPVANDGTQPSVLSWLGQVFSPRKAQRGKK